MTGGQIAVAAAIGVTSFALSLAAAAVVVVRLPPDYFVSGATPLPLAGSPMWLRVGVRVAQNLLGVILVLLGVLLSLPGVPGQGFLTILLGLMLVDVPGKRRLELVLVRRPAVRRTIDRLRARYRKEPIRLPGDPPPSTRNLASKTQDSPNGGPAPE